jgi:flagellar hook-associated protein 3 FlgL
MRVTERSRIDAMNLAQGRASARLDKAARVASNGQRVTKPSDDPAAYGAMVRRDYALATLEEHAKIASRAQGELDVVQNVLSTAVDIMARAQETAVNGLNDTTGESGRKLLAEDVRTMRDELLSIANTRYGDKYLFGGSKTDTMPFDQVNGAFYGNDQIVRVPVLAGVTPPSNVSGAKAFTSVGGRDIFADLAALAQALDANDEDAIRTASKPLTDGHAQLVRSQVDAGFSSERFRDAADVLTSTKAAITEQLSKEIEGDPATQLTELTLARTAYERSIAVTKELLAITTTG